jgi:adenosylmethionine-8-amino-7-oxononanoate aminotransferase
MAANGHATQASEKPASAILGRVTWKLPIAIAGEGIYIDLQDGRRLVDGVGGAAVAAIGNGNPTVKQAIKDQVEKVSCNLGFHLSEIYRLQCRFRCLQHAALQ